MFTTPVTEHKVTRLRKAKNKNKGSAFADLNIAETVRTLSYKQAAVKKMFNNRFFFLDDIMVSSEYEEHAVIFPCNLKRRAPFCILVIS